jgi:thioredoxin 1
MKTLLATCAALIVGLVAVHIIGCSEDIEQEVDPVAFVSASPQIGSEIAANDTVTVTFDDTPVDVSVRVDSDTKVGKTVITGKTVTIHGPFVPGELNLTVTWLDGNKTLTYTVTAPDPEDSKAVDEAIDDGRTDPEPIRTDGKPVKVSDKTFKAVVLDAEVPVVLELGADWCGFCRMMDPTVKAVALEYRDSFIVARLDVDENPQTAKKYGRRGIPAYIVFRNGRVVGKMIGAMPKAVFVQRILDTLK